MSTASPTPSDTLRRVLHDDEELRWRARPHRTRFLIDNARLAVPILGVLAMVGIFLTWMIGLAVEFSGGDPLAVLRIMGAIGIVVVFLVVGIVVWFANRRYGRIEYAATDRRVLSVSGAVGRDTSSVEWGHVRDVEVTVDALDRPFDTGTIHVATEGSGGIAMHHLERPYEVAATLDSSRSGAGSDGGPHAGGTTASETPSTSTGTAIDTEPGSGSAADHATGPREDRTWGRRTRRDSPAAERVSSTVERLLRDGEELRWQHRPPLRRYLLQSVVGAVFAGLLVWSIAYVLLVVVPVTLEIGPFGRLGGQAASMLGTTVRGALVYGWVLVQVVWMLLVTLGTYRASDRLELVATDQRAIKVGGMVGLDTTSVEWEDVTDIEVERNLMTRLFGTGNIVIKSGGGGKPYRGGGIRYGPVVDPMEVLARIEAIERGEDDGPAIMVGRAGGATSTIDRHEVGGSASGSPSAQAEAMLRDGEAVLWSGRPALLPYVVPSVLGGVGAMAFGVGFYAIDWTLFAVFTFFGGASMAGKRVLSYRNAEYVATDQRLLTFGGAIGRDSSSVEWNHVQDVEVDVGPFDLPFGTGTLRFSRAGGATPAEARDTGGDDGSVFTGVRFQRVAGPRAIADVLERGRGDD